MSATYQKLKDGSWGIRLKGPKPSKGDRVAVSKKSGETKEEVIDRVLWSGDGVHLCSVAGNSGCGSPGSPRRRARSSYPRTGCSCGSREGYPQETDCFTCRHDE